MRERTLHMNVIMHPRTYENSWTAFLRLAFSAGCFIRIMWIRHLSLKELWNEHNVVPRFATASVRIERNPILADMKMHATIANLNGKVAPVCTLNGKLLSFHVLQNNSMGKIVFHSLFCLFIHDLHFSAVIIRILCAKIVWDVRNNGNEFYIQVH